MTEQQDVAQARRGVLVVALVLGLLAAWQLHRAHLTLAYSFGIAGIVALGCSAVPVAAVVFYRWWMAFASALGYVNSRVLLSLVYYLFVSPIGAVARLLGHDPLDRRRPRQASYWIARPKPRQSRQDFEKSF